MSQDPRRSTFDLLNQAVDSLLRINFDQKVNMIGHNFQFDDFATLFSNRLAD